MAHMLAGQNLGLATSRNVETDEVEHVFCSQHVMGHHAVSLKEVNFLYPLYLYGDAASKHNKPSLFSGRKVNFNAQFLTALAQKLHLKTDADGLPENISGEDILGYAHAVFSSSSYRTRYEDFLRRDFPRLPLTSDALLFSALASCGRELASIQVMDLANLNELTTEFPVRGSNEVGQVTYDPHMRRVSVNAEQHFDGVPQDVWSFTIGGYRVCEQWLEDRKRRKLTYDDVQHWQRIVVAITKTMRLIKEIDALIPGWPLP